MSEPDSALETIRSIAVDPEAVVDAFVYTRENPGAAVLRVTPPFHGRMRARLHVFRDEDSAATGAAHCRPASLLPEEVADAYPSPADGATDRAVEDWRELARESLVERAVLERDDERVRVGVTRLG